MQDTRQAIHHKSHFSRIMAVILKFWFGSPTMTIPMQASRVRFFGEQAAMLKVIRTAQPLNWQLWLYWLPYPSFFSSVIWDLRYIETGMTLCYCSAWYACCMPYNGMISERVLAAASTDLSFSTLYKLKDFCSVACLGLLIFYFYRFRTGMFSGSSLL